MDEKFFETHVNMVFFLAGAIVGILGGLLSGFCVTAYYRWFDFYNKETTIHPNSFPISIDFWVFLFSLIAIITLTYIFYCAVVKILDKIKTSRDSSTVSSEDMKSEPIIPIIIEKCPICGKIFKGQSNYCEICGKQLSTIKLVENEEYSESRSFDLIITFFKNNSNLFTILASIAALITLTSVFSTFFASENWFDSILSSPIGAQCFVLILISSFGLAFFAYYILSLISLDFFNEVVKNKKIWTSVKIQATIFMIVGLIAVASSFLFLILNWFRNIEFLRSVISLYSLFFVIVVPIFLILIGLFWEALKRSKKCLEKVINVIIILILVCGILLTIIPIIQGTLVITGEMSKYYSGKNVPIEINYTVNQSTDRPSIVYLGVKGDVFFADKPVSELDLLYKQCHWSTNYGYFVSVSSNNSVVKKSSQEILIPDCGTPDSKIFWTYDIADYGKNKSLVLIGLSVEDRYKTINNNLGFDSLVINWSSTDNIKIENDSNLFFK